MRTLPLLVVWMLVWGTGWALFFVSPASSSGLGALLLLGASLCALLSAWRRDPPARGTGILLTGLVFLFLLLVFVLPPSYRWQFPTGAPLRTLLEGFGAIVAVFGIAVNCRRFLRSSYRAS